ncbi:VOC family protein [Leptothoe sp. PORK10 BA2]|uniref:VOC family protein n=1 Tax=Leptothoe sp. PORK10 BA2 TaxID=3110254 RepID=UPI002B20BA6F|nr:VOC family protein [Leptothoe sp. PORK10 BA2]MEA5462960.1 VOC family protein [Leptothoe sp. PORK10 BA2]
MSFSKKDGVGAGAVGCRGPQTPNYDGFESYPLAPWGVNGYVRRLKRFTMVVADATAAAERLQDAGVPFISSGPVALTESMFDFRQGFLVRDPDGHAIRIVEN